MGVRVVPHIYLKCCGFHGKWKWSCRTSYLGCGMFKISDLLRLILKLEMYLKYEDAEITLGRDISGC